MRNAFLLKVPMFNYSTLAHQNLEICSPVPWGVYENLLLSSTISARPEILDIGCGKAGVLARAIEATNGSGIGIDLPNSLGSVISVRAEKLRKLGSLTIILEDAKAFVQRIDNSFDLIICIGSSHAMGGPQQLFNWAKKLLKPDGKLLFGEIVWRSKPSKEFLEFLECGEEDQLYSSQLFDLARKSGFLIEQTASCLETDFDRYENELKSAIETWTVSNATHPMAGEFRKRSESWSKAREKWARHASGFDVLIAGRG